MASKPHSTTVTTDSTTDPMKTEADFLVQADKARSALEQFANLQKLENPADFLIKSAMDQILKTIVSPVSTVSYF
jgi:hypothetical protein